MIFFWIQSLVVFCVISLFWYGYLIIAEAITSIELIQRMNVWLVWLWLIPVLHCIHSSCQPHELKILAKWWMIDIWLTSSRNRNSIVIWEFKTCSYRYTETERGTHTNTFKDQSCNLYQCFMHTKTSNPSYLYIDIVCHQCFSYFHVKFIMINNVGCRHHSFFFFLSAIAIYGILNKMHYAFKYRTDLWYISNE